jgi:2-polyprenyl-3-methyl-5-hydroxy-6-metoxy-1,4-benzoquinol methylase
MVGLKEQNDNNFTPDKYEEFYEHHYFEPIPDNLAFDVHEVIPRFGWGFDKVEELSQGKKNFKLLDLGCLDGSFALSVAKNLGIFVTGVDLTKDGIDIANERAKQLKTPTRFVQGTVEHWLEAIAESGEKFEVITFFEIIEHVEDVQLCLKLIDKVLAPGGSVLVSTPAFEDPIYGKDDEANTCHVRLYTMEDEDREEHNKYGTLRKATSITKEIGKDRIKEMNLHNGLINVLYQ